MRWTTYRFLILSFLVSTHAAAHVIEEGIYIQNVAKWTLDLEHKIKIMASKARLSEDQATGAFLSALPVMDAPKSKYSSADMKKKLSLAEERLSLLHEQNTLVQEAYKRFQACARIIEELATTTKPALGILQSLSRVDFDITTDGELQDLQDLIFSSSDTVFENYERALEEAKIIKTEFLKVFRSHEVSLKHLHEYQLASSLIPPFIARQRRSHYVRVR